MKKKLIATMVGILLMAVLVACGKNYKVGKNGEVYNDIIKINQYKGLEVDKVEVREVTDEDVEASIPYDLQWLCTSTEEYLVDRPAQMGDTITFDFVGKMDGKEFSGGSAQDQLLELGSELMIPGFEEQIVGHSIGEVFDINVTFPDPYQQNPDFSGKAAVFTITLDGILPELTDEIVPLLNENAKNVDDYKAKVKEYLQKSSEASAKQQLSQELYEALLAQCVVSKYSEEELEESIKDATEYYTEYAQQWQMTLDDLVSQMGLDIEDAAKTPLRLKYALELIAEVEKIEITDKVYKERLQQLSEEQGLTEAQLEEEYGADELKERFLEEKVMDLLIENCKQVDATSETE